MVKFYHFIPLIILVILTYFLLDWQQEIYDKKSVELQGWEDNKSVKRE